MKKKTHRNIIPILIHHHNTEQHTKREEEQPVDIMLDRITYRHAKRKQQHHAARIKHRAKDDIANWPPVFERAEDEDELQDDVDGDADEWPEEVDDE